METTVLCANCFGMIPYGTVCSSLLISDGNQTAVHDRDFCPDCGEKFIAIVDKDAGESGACAVCRGKVDGRFGYLQVVHKSDEYTACICPTCVAALSRSIGALKERRESVSV